MTKHYFIYCDESIEKGQFYSDFYGGLLVNSDDFEEVVYTLQKKMNDLNLFNEVKWIKTTENYLEKYKSLIDTFFFIMHFGSYICRMMYKNIFMFCKFVEQIVYFINGKLFLCLIFKT